MRNVIFLLIALIALFFAAQGVLHLMYGPSYPWLPSEDEWIPDSHGGWVKHGAVDEPPPAVPSVDVPVFAHYVPIFLPALLLGLFLFTPLRRKLDDRNGPVEVEIDPDNGSDSADNNAK